MPDAALTAQIDTLPAAQRPVVLAYLNADWQTYERLDPNRAILRAAYELAPRELRRALGSVGRTGGRTEIVEILATSQTDPPTPHIPTTPTEADILFETLTAQRRYADLWKLAQTAAPLLSARILVWLDKEGWQPDTTEDRAIFPHLVKLARACADLSPQYGLMYKKRRISFYRTFGAHDYTKVTSDAQTLIAVRNGRLEFYNLPTKKLLAVIPGTVNTLSSNIQISPDDKFLLWDESYYYGRRAMLHLIDLSNFCVIKRFDNLLENFDIFNILNNGIIVVHNLFPVRSRKYQWLIANLVTDNILEGFEGPILEYQSCRTVSSPNNKILAGFQSKQIWFWDLEERQWLLQLDSEYQLHFDGNILFSPDSEIIAINGYEGIIHLLHIKTGELISQITTSYSSRSRSSFDAEFPSYLTLAFSNDGKFLAVGSCEQNISLYNIETGQLVQNLLWHGSSVDQIIFREDGTILSISITGLVRIWASRLTELCERPLEQNEMRILRWMSKQLNRSDLTAAERGWLEFTQAMLHLRWRYAVEIETDAAYKVRAAPADIEL
jgi:hypothetical protein